MRSILECPVSLQCRRGGIVLSHHKCPITDCSKVQSVLRRYLRRPNGPLLRPVTSFSSMSADWTFHPNDDTAPRRDNPAN